MAYIDPGTGSMLFTILLGTLTAGTYAFRDSIVKARFYLSGGRTAKSAEDCPEYAIFSDSKRYWNVFEPICDEFESRKKEIVYMTASPDDPALAKNYEHVKCEFIGEGNKAFAKLNNLKTDIVLSTTPSLDVFYWKRSKTVKWYVHIPHASNDITFYRMFGIDFFDAILTPGEYHKDQIRKLEQARNLPEKELVTVGVTYMDEMKARLNKTKTGSKNNDETTVLLAPSWGPSSILNMFKDEIIDRLIDTGYHIIVRPHPQSFTSEKEMLDRMMDKYKENDKFEWNADNDNFDVLSRADIMISDFSGVVYDFSLVFDKPVIYADAEFDPAPYDACWIDEQPWSFRTLPKIGTQITKENLSDIKSLIDEAIASKGLQAARDSARKETWAYEGEAAKRTVDYLIKKHEEIENADQELSN